MFEIGCQFPFIDEVELADRIPVVVRGALDGACLVVDTEYEPGSRASAPRLCSADAVRR